MPNVEPLITLLIVKSFAVVPSSATVNVLVALKATGQEIVALAAPPVLSVTVTLPPKVNVDEPEIVPPVTAQPPSSETALAVTACDSEKVLADLTDKLETVVKATPVVVVPPEMIRLLKVVKVDEGNVLFAVNSTVPVLGVHVHEPCPMANEPVSNVELATIVIIPGASSPLVDFVNIIEPACKVEPLTKVIVPPRLEFVLPSPPMVTAPVTVSLGLPEDAKVSVALVCADVPPICKLAQTALVIFTVTDKLALLDPLAAKVTASELVGTPLGFQLLALFQLTPSPPPSQVFWALAAFIPKNKRKNSKNNAEKHDR